MKYDYIYEPKINKIYHSKHILYFPPTFICLFLQLSYENVEFQNFFVANFRVHACLYFITPNGHGLKSIDLVCMKKLDSKVNIIPIIAKADTINKAELTKFKTKIMAELSNNGVQIYQFPTGKKISWLKWYTVIL